MENRVLLGRVTVKKVKKSHFSPPFGASSRQFLTFTISMNCNLKLALYSNAGLLHWTVPPPNSKCREWHCTIGFTVVCRFCHDTRQANTTNNYLRSSWIDKQSGHATPVPHSTLHCVELEVKLTINQCMTVQCRLVFYN